jgi:molybdopterin/thiamine biosynthesis adenylyltransferase
LPNALDDYLLKHKELLPEQFGDNGLRRFPLRLPNIPEGRSFGQAWLELPRAFPDNGLARIRLSAENVLKVPHIEVDGKLCVGEGDPGPLSGASPISRVQQLVEAFYELFLRPWCAGELDGDFAHEAQNYWAIHCERYSSWQDAVSKVYTLEERHGYPRIYKARYLSGQRIVIACSDHTLSNRFISAMGEKQQLRQVLVADIPVSFSLTPDTWPRDQASLERLLHMRLGRNVAGNFLSAKGHRGRSIHRIVILRAPDCSFGFLLPGGPPTLIRRGYSTRAYPTWKLIPLQVERLDSNWTYGRDQHPEILIRQQKHILVIGAGALGSPVIEQLAKAGIGHLTIIDGDIVSAANIGRHVLGANSIGFGKAKALAEQLTRRWPSCTVSAEPNSIQHWLKHHDLSGVDMVVDLTGEPDVRLCIEIARREYGCSLLIGWMEPYVAAAHACLLPDGQPWMTGPVDRLESLQAVTWPDDVMQHEPSCSSIFQSYTSAAATHAVALVTEAVLDLLDGKVKRATVRHWVRGQAFLNAQYPGLNLREWAIAAAPFDGISFETFYE